MNSIFKVVLNTDHNELEDYEKNESYLIHFSIQLPNGQIVSGNDYRVQIAISEDGMLGLGTELIRKAMRLKNSQTKPIQEVEELTPINSTGGSEGGLGVYLTHDSCECIFGVGDLGTISEQMKKAAKT